MCSSLIEIGSKTAEKNSAQTNRQTNRLTNRQTDTTKIMALGREPTIPLPRCQSFGPRTSAVLALHSTACRPVYTCTRGTGVGVCVLKCSGNFWKLVKTYHIRLKNWIYLIYLLLLLVSGQCITIHIPEAVTKIVSWRGDVSGRATVCYSRLAELFMVALCNRADHYIFALWFLSIYLSFFPRLISAVGDWMSTILPHVVWP